MKFISFLVLMGLTVSCSTWKNMTKTESQKFNAFLEQSFEEYLNENPELLTEMGTKKHYDRFNDYSEAFEVRMKDWNEKKLLELKNFDRSKMDEITQTSYDLFEKRLKDTVEDFEWRDYQYPFNQMYGIHTGVPSFLINMHRVDQESDVSAYVARLRDVPRVLNQVVEQVQRSEKKGIKLPHFVYPYVLQSANNVIQGVPYTEKGEDAPLWKDFQDKLKKLKLPADKEKVWLDQGRKALVDDFKPAYEKMIQSLKQLQARADKKDGAWKFPKGEQFYALRVRRHTTTDLTPDEIHKIGLENVSRIHTEMRKVLKDLKFNGSLQSFFKAIRTQKKYYYPNTDEGRVAYMEVSQQFYQQIQTQIPQFFRLLPKAPFEIRAVEKFRENSAGIAFYEPPSEDGSRPGVYYVNLKDMKDLPKHEAEVILYHEGAPGHHFQIALAQELKGLPKFRRFSHYTSFIEGWGLYTERLAKEMGAYKDPLSEFGRLSAELLRAARLVVDTGIHSKKWSREKALAYYRDNLPSSLGDQKGEVERYIVMPGQATAYMIGKLKIEELRARSEKRLGKLFDIRDFHDTVLGSGALPLSQLEKNIETYIHEKSQPE